MSPRYEILNENLLPFFSFATFPCEFIYLMFSAFQLNVVTRFDYKIVNLLVLHTFSLPF